MNFELLEHELKQIKNEGMRGLATGVIIASPDYLDTAPASSSGLYHPKDETFEGGFIRHLKKCFKLAKQAARRYEMDELDTEILKTACLIHDLPFRYFRIPNKAGSTDKLHPFKNANYLIDKFQPKKGSEDWYWFPKLVAAVYYHMGIWADYKSKEALKNIEFVFRYNGNLSKKGHVTLATQECDYYSSRKFVQIELDEENYKFDEKLKNFDDKLRKL